MEDRQRRLLATIVMVISLVIVAYLVFFTPSESTISTPIGTDASATQVGPGGDG